MLKRLFTPVDIASLIFFRFVFGILAFADVMGLWTYYHLYENDFDPAGFRFKYYGFEWLEPLPEPLMSAFFILLLIAALCIAAGYKYRAGCALLFTGFTYVFLLEKTHYLNHGYLFCWLSLVMAFLPADREFSKAVHDNPALRRSTVPYVNIFVLQALMAIVYFYGGLAKINSDWLLHASPLKMWIGYKGDMPLLGWLWRQELTAWVMSWSGMLLDLLIVFALLFRKTRIPALLFVFFFHITNTILFQIGIFPWLSIALTLLFFPPSRPRLWIAWLEKKLKFVGKIRNWWSKKTGKESQASEIVTDFALLRGKESATGWKETFAAGRLLPEPYSARRKRVILVALGLLFAVHLTLPFRQYLYPGPTAWSEEGHRYSWRMMLRQKRGYGKFYVETAQSEERIKVNPRDFLSKKQLRKMYTHPDMILQFAHFLRDKYEAEGSTEVKVFADIKVSLNGRRYQQYIDKETDLAQEEWSLWRHTEWIEEFEDTEIR